MKNILIVGYPRSGNTFLGYLLSYHFNAPYYDMYDLSKVISRKSKSEGMTLAPEAFSGAFERTDQKKEINAVLKTHELPDNLYPRHKSSLDYVAYNESDPPVLITREPKDVAVSYFYYTFFRQAFVKRYWSRHLPYAVRHWYYYHFHFEKFALRVANEWSELTINWHELKPLVIRYEELLKQPEEQIQRVADEFGLCFYARYAKEAAEFCELSNLRKLEKARNPEIQENERKYRTGKIGNWKSFFSPRLHLRFDNIARRATELVG